MDVPHIKDESIMAEHLAASDIFVYPTIADNCPLGVLEAMACGLPVVSCNVGGLPELVDHLLNGYLADPENPKDFATGMQTFIENKNTQREAGRAARKKIEEKFTLRHMIAAYQELYDELMTDQNCLKPNKDHRGESLLNL
jgi:glycosyltransferase involved in cell wall biosynthesis